MAKVRFKIRPENPNLRVGARNSEKPYFYRLVVDGKRGSIAFPTPESKAYYLNCIKTILPAFPVEILAYTLVTNRAYFIVATFDQQTVSHMRMMQAVNKAYSQYYNKYYKGAGYVFKTTVRSKRIKDLLDVADSIMIVHSQPYATRLSDSYSYEFSSYNERPGTGIANLNSFYFMVGEVEEGDAILGAAHAKGPRFLPADFVNLPEIDKFDVIMDNIMVDYGYYDRDRVPNDVMHRAITELNERGGYSFDYITKRLDLNEENKYEMLIKVIVDLALTFDQTYDESISNLGIEFTSNSKARSTLMDVVVVMSNRTGYSYDYIMNVLGLAYPNYGFLVELIRYMSDMKGLSFVSCIKKLGIYHEPEYVLRLVEGVEEIG